MLSEAGFLERLIETAVMLPLLRFASCGVWFSQYHVQMEREVGVCC